jgi:hypothetical protein
MANWKKVIVSGSTANLAGLQVDGLTSGQVVIGGGSGSILTSTPINGTGNIVATTGATSLSHSGSFSGSFQGDGSGLTGLVNSLNISGSTGNGSVDLLNQTLSILGTTNQITTVASGQSVTISLPSNLTIPSNLIVPGDLVVNGTASFQNTQNLLVSDRFVLFASGSITTGDGGIVVQQGTQNVGELFGYENTANRWAITSSYNAASSSFTPSEYMVTARGASGGPLGDPIYGGASTGYGNIYVDTSTDDIYIWA